MHANRPAPKPQGCEVDSLSARPGWRSHLHAEQDFSDNRQFERLFPSSCGKPSCSPATQPPDRRSPALPFPSPPETREARPQPAHTAEAARRPNRSAAGFPPKARGISALRCGEAHDPRGEDRRGAAHAARPRSSPAAAAAAALSGSAAAPSPRATAAGPGRRPSLRRRRQRQQRRRPPPPPHHPAGSGRRQRQHAPGRGKGGYCAEQLPEGAAVVPPVEVFVMCK
ncbi:uncharacterized protein LOC130602975 [Pezoporus wallicus]|uniref:uncharacterized protein LOC130602975 n=1 Tax=Pezoporus wallicus TaxID=35540 RepID=UPI00254D375D|nr:uncharacterized protein LOC130602975 [Pezoporus wallicus]